MSATLIHVQMGQTVSTDVTDIHAIVLLAGTENSALSISMNVSATLV